MSIVEIMDTSYENCAAGQCHYGICDRAQAKDQS